MNKRTQYRQLQAEERKTIASLHLQGSRIRAMARILGCPAATFSCELMRNSFAVGDTSVPAKTPSVAPQRESPLQKALRPKRLLACRSYFARVELAASAAIGQSL
jgi:IS30 family transposase